jgi:hypothetical protein
MVRKLSLSHLPTLNASWIGSHQTMKAEKLEVEEAQ